MSAVYMVAFGVLEYKPVQNRAVQNRADEDKLAAASEILKLVGEEFAARGWLLQRGSASALSMPPMYDAFVLHGPMKTTSAWTMREKIAAGKLKRVCEAAVAHDVMWSEIPD